jgi:hypothetical protein
LTSRNAAAIAAILYLKDKRFAGLKADFIKMAQYGDPKY